MRCSAPLTRPSSPEATSSTHSRSCTKACWSAAACAARSVSSPPRTVRWAARMRRSFRLRTTTQTKASSASAAAASATMPCVEFRSSTPPGYSAGSAGEDDREVGLVVVRDLLAGHRLDRRLDGHLLARGRLPVQRDGHVLRLARSDLGQRLLELVCVGALADGH